MASQIGQTRIYTSKESETDAAAVQTTCKNCKVIAVARGINSTRTSAAGEKHCPNCGHIHGRDNH